MEFKYFFKQGRKSIEQPPNSNDRVDQITDHVRSSITRTEKMSRTTGRSLEFYEQFLELTPSDLNGKKILNIGAGRSDINSELEREGVEPEILIHLDFAYKNIGDSKGVFKRVSGKALSKENVPLNAVAGDMKQLPFADNELDDVICLWSVGWLRDKDKPTAISEAYRVCKNNGEIKIYPVSFTKKAQEIAQKYPFIQISKPQYDVQSLYESDMENKNIQGKVKQFLSNFDGVQIERLERLVEGVKGKRVGTLTIKKSSDVDLNAFNSAIQELDKNGFTF